ncbi:hypothetical protein NM688_g436 [Phlebia brevispora]|uniref:Uncharacterized protein n=1 Tax=Phlebia brevispora TaxID=194682 RepID=A0ACC1TEG8_9APHY|nr:hypothetical protein NM688_g436 [Phlebia brevispora]
MIKLVNLIYLALAFGGANAFYVPDKRAEGGYVQVTSGNASFTEYWGCSEPACGIVANGFTAAMNQLSFGAPSGVGPGDACGRCFAVTADYDPYSPAYTGPWGQTIVVKITDLCPVEGNEVWCGQTATNDTNQFGQPFHFDLCVDSGAAAQFFPANHDALIGNFTEVPCSEWSGSDGSPLWPGACLAGESAPLWPSVGCGNQGTAPGAPAAPSSASSVSSSSTTSPSTPTTSAPPSTQTEWGQCGGTSWTGPTTCVSPLCLRLVSVKNLEDPTSSNHLPCLIITMICSHAVLCRVALTPPGRNVNATCSRVTESASRSHILHNIMQSPVVQLAIYDRWWIWSGIYRDNGGVSPTNDPVDSKNGYDPLTAFPSRKPAFDVFGIPSRSRKQRGWYQVKPWPPSSLHIATVASVERSFAVAADTPPEMFEQILEGLNPDYLTTNLNREDRHALSMCSLVCRYWADKCRKVLYNRLCLRARADVLALRNFDQDPGAEIFKYWGDSDIQLEVDSLPQMPWIHVMTTLLQNARQPGPAVRVTLKGPLPRGWKSLRSLHQGLPKTPRIYSYGITHLVLSNIHFRRLYDLVHLVDEIPYLSWLECEQLSWEILPSGIPLTRRRSGNQPGPVSTRMLIMWKCGPTWASAALLLFPNFVPISFPWFSQEGLTGLLALGQTIDSTTEDTPCTAHFQYYEGGYPLEIIVLDLSFQDLGSYETLPHRLPGHHPEATICRFSVKADSVTTPNHLPVGNNDDRSPILDVTTIALEVKILERVTAFFNWEGFDEVVCTFPRIKHVVFGFPSRQDMTRFVENVVSKRLPLLTTRNLIRYAIHHIDWFRTSPQSDEQQRTKRLFDLVLVYG